MLIFLPFFYIVAYCGRAPSPSLVWEGEGVPPLQAAVQPLDLDRPAILQGDIRLVTLRGFRGRPAARPTMVAIQFLHDSLFQRLAARAVAAHGQVAVGDVQGERQHMRVLERSGHMHDLQPLPADTIALQLERGAGFLALEQLKQLFGGVQSDFSVAAGGERERKQVGGGSDVHLCGAGGGGAVIDVGFSVHESFPFRCFLIGLYHQNAHMSIKK